MAGVLRGDDGGLALGDPVDELHHVLEDVLLPDPAMRADDVGKEGRVALLAFERARCAEVPCAEARVDAAGGDAVDDGEQALAEVEQHERVVVRVGRHEVACELALTDPHA